MKRKRSHYGLLLLIGGMALAFAMGRALRLASASGSRPRARQASTLSEGGAASTKPQVGQRVGAIPPSAAAELSRPAALLSKPQPAQDARRAVQALLSRLNRGALPGAVPELTANMSRTFLVGWLDALRYTSSEVLDSIAEDLRSRICKDGLSAEESIFIGQVFQYAPEVSSLEAFECFFGRFPDEGASLWTMLDAWRNSGLEPVPALERIRKTAVDPRTQVRIEAAGDPAPEGSPEEQ
jgi:hypothetical protein